MKKTAAALVLLSLLALGLRFVGIGFLLPHITHGDVNLVEQSDLIRRDAPDKTSRVNYGKYPLLIAYASQVLPDPTPPGDPAPRSLEAHLADASLPLLELRWLVAVLGSLLVPGTWFLARRFVGPRLALVSAFLVATSLLHISYSQQARPHAVVASASLLAVLACLRVVRSGRTRDYALAGLGVALAVGALHNGVATLLPLAVAVLVRLRADGARAGLRALLPLVLLAAAVLAFYPMAFVAPPASGAESAAAEVELEGARLALPGHLIFLDRFDGSGFERVLGSLWHYEPWMTVLCALALLPALGAALRRRPPARRAELLVVLSYVVPYLLVVGLYRRTHARFLLPALPFLALFATTALASVGRALDRAPRARAPLRALTLLLVLVPPLACAVRLVLARRAPDTATRAARWIDEQVGPGRERILLLPTMDLPLFETAECLAANATRHAEAGWRGYQQRVPETSRSGPHHDLRVLPLRTKPARRRAAQDPVAFLRAQRADYAVFEVIQPRQAHDAVHDLYHAARTTGDLLARISPDPDPRLHDEPLLYDEHLRLDMPHYAWRVLHARSFGPVIEIYRLGTDSRGQGH